MSKFLITRIQAFGYAFSGWWHVLRTQRNAWVHSLATVLALGFAAWLQINRVEWAILIVTIALVWMAEFFNTAIEAVVDLASPQRHPLAKAAKDVAAAAVLITALASILVGLLILGPPLLVKFKALLP